MAIPCRRLVRPRERFAEVVRGADDAIDLAEAALLIAAEAYPDLDVARYLGKLDELAAAASAAQDGAGSERRTRSSARAVPQRGRGLSRQPRRLLRPPQ
jgi:hypothetical protein